jgi:hypothetical protein
MVYVNDLFITRSLATLISTLKQFLQQTFSMIDLGVVQHYLGVLFQTLLQGIFLHQLDYARSILQDFSMLDCRPATVSMPEGTILLIDMMSPYVDSPNYCKLVGKLIFLTITRADIAYAVNRVSSYMAQPQQAHLHAVLHILRYICGSLDFGILYQNSTQTIHTVDWGSCPETRHSIGTYIFFYSSSRTYYLDEQETTYRVTILHGS